MSFKNYQLLAKKFGYGAVSHALKYSLINKFTFYKELQGLTVTMETLDPRYLEIDEKYTCRFLTKEELHAYARDEANQITTQFLDETLPKGDFCYAILEGDVLASYGWYSDKPTHISSDLKLVFDPSWIYMYKGYTLPAYRGQRLHAIGMARSLQAFTEKGYKGIISYVETNNFPSLRSCDRMGYKNFGRIKIIKKGGGYQITPESACAAYNFSVEVEK
jgi:hypothetical protein